MIPDCDGRTVGRSDRQNLSWLRQHSAQQATLTRCQKLLVQKPCFTRNSHSRSLYVIHFAIRHRLTRDCLSQYNNAGLNCKVSKEVLMKIAENCRSRNQIYRPTFLPLIVWVYLHSKFCSGLQKTHRFCNRVHVGRSRSSKVDDFGTNRKLMCDFLLVCHHNYGPILHYF